MAVAPHGQRLRRAVGATVMAALLVAVAPAVAAPLLSHTPPSGAVECGPITLTAVPSAGTDPRTLASADIVAVGPWGERVLPMVPHGNVLRGAIPRELVSAPSVSYYLRIADANGETFLYPPGAPATLVIVPVAASPERGPCDDGAEEARPESAVRSGDTARGRVEMVSPAGDVSPSGSLELAFLIEPPLSGAWEAFLYLDGRDMTARADVSPGFIVLERTPPLSPGVHTVTVSTFDDAGLLEQHWSIVCVGDARVDEALPREERRPSRTGHGWIEVGWAGVAADTTAADSLDVYLPYDETGMPTLDFYASSYEPGRTLIMSASYDPVYYDRLRWSWSVETDRVRAEVGDVYASLSDATVDWASGLGVRAAAGLGAVDAEAVAMRLAPADTAGGLGIYARYLAAAAVEGAVAEGARAALVFAHAFDDEQSVPAGARVGEPLENDVAAAVVEFTKAAASVRVEAASSTSTGETEGDGDAVRAGVGYTADAGNRISLDYLYSDPEFYSAGSLDTRPGERGLELEFAWSPCSTCWASGSAGAYRRTDVSQDTDPDEVGFRVYGRLDGSWDVGANAVRAYVTARAERLPYESYDYEYEYGGAGGTWSRGPVRASVGLTRSSSRATVTTTLDGLSLDLRYSTTPRRVTARAAGHWSRSSEGGVERYARTTYTLEMKLHLAGEAYISSEYRRMERDDSSEPEQSYVEHIFRTAFGLSF